MAENDNLAAFLANFGHLGKQLFAGLLAPNTAQEADAIANTYGQIMGSGTPGVNLGIMPLGPGDFPINEIPAHPAILKAVLKDPRNVQMIPMETRGMSAPGAWRRLPGIKQNTGLNLDALPVDNPSPASRTIKNIDWRMENHPTFKYVVQASHGDVPPGTPFRIGDNLHVWDNKGNLYTKNGTRSFGEELPVTPPTPTHPKTGKPLSETETAIGNWAFDNLHPDLKETLGLQGLNDPRVTPDALNRGIIGDLHRLPPEQVQAELSKLWHLKNFKQDAVRMVDKPTWEYIRRWMNEKRPPEPPTGGTPAPIEPSPKTTPPQQSLQDFHNQIQGEVNKKMQDWTAPRSLTPHETDRIISRPVKPGESYIIYHPNTEYLASYGKPMVMRTYIGQPPVGGVWKPALKPYLHKFTDHPAVVSGEPFHMAGNWYRYNADTFSFARWSKK